MCTRFHQNIGDRKNQMKIIQSFIPSRFTTENIFYFTVPKEIIYIQMLSVLLAKREYGDVYFFTNKVIKEQIEKIGIPYSYIDCEILDEFSDHLFCTPKLLVYRSMNEPYVHIDIDTLIYKKIDFDQFDCSVFYSHPDLRTPQYADKERAFEIYKEYPALDDCEMYFYRSKLTYLDPFYSLYDEHSDFKKSNIKISEVPNMNIVGVRDFKNFGLASGISLLHYFKNKEKILKFENGPCYVEQLMIHLNLLEISEEYRNERRSEKRFILPDAPLRFENLIPQSFNEVKFPIRMTHNSHLDSFVDKEIRKDGFLYERKHELFGHEGRISSIDSIEDLKRIFQFDFYGLSHLTHYKRSDILQAIVIGTIVENFGPEYARSVYDYFKGIIKNGSYNVRALSGGEKLYQDLTGFVFDKSQSLV